jgi:hypothetical protein
MRGTPEARVYRTFIFFRAGLASVSPAVNLWWAGKVINLFRQFPAEALHYGAFADGACADFIVACSRLEKTKDQPIEVFNLPLRWEGQDRLTAKFDMPAHSEQWRAWLFEEIERLSADRQDLPILVDLDPPFHVTQGGRVLFQRADGRNYQEGDPLWMTPAQANRLAKARVAALKRWPKPTGMSVDEYEALLRDRLEAAGFDFRHPDRKLACRVFLASGWEPVACNQTFLYYEARDDGIEFGRWFQHGPEPGAARHERVAHRFSSPKLRGYEFQSTMGICAGAEVARTFARMLSEIFTSGPDRRVSRWRVELRRYEPHG